MLTARTEIHFGTISSHYTTVFDSVVVPQLPPRTLLPATPDPVCKGEIPKAVRS